MLWARRGRWRTAGHWVTDSVATTALINCNVFCWKTPQPDRQIACTGSVTVSQLCIRSFFLGFSCPHHERYYKLHLHSSPCMSNQESYYTTATLQLHLHATCKSIFEFTGFLKPGNLEAST